MIAVIGLGYVGRPLFEEFGKKYATVGFDTDPKKTACDFYTFRNAIESAHAKRETVYFIVTVPTPVDAFNNPDLQPLRSASKMIGGLLGHGDIVIYESTTYPGCTEEVCVPILAEESGMEYNRDFFVGYSPERINPGDKVNTLTKIRKITSGSTPEVAEKIDALYNSILENGTYKAPSMKVAEAAKAVENSQRDLNISFMNELALICDRLEIDTNDVIDAAATKWNFQPFRPGLVGGHCISVDPYYLAHKAKELGYDPKVILSGRAVNNSIAKFIADKTLKLLIKSGKPILNTQVLILGITFKENCPDFRNTKVIDIAHELEEFGCQVDIYDPWADKAQVKKELGVDLLESIDPQTPYKAIIACVAHLELVPGEHCVVDYARYKEQGAILFDVKGMLPRALADARL